MQRVYGSLLGGFSLTITGIAWYLSAAASATRDIGPGESKKHSGHHHLAAVGGNSQASADGIDEELGSEPAQTASLGEALIRLREANEHLQKALLSRIVIEQAKGVLAERYRLSMDDAFDLLRYAARTTRTNLHVFAQGLIELDPQPEDAVVAAVATPDRWQRPRIDGGALRAARPRLTGNASA